MTRRFQSGTVLVCLLALAGAGCRTDPSSAVDTTAWAGGSAAGGDDLVAVDEEKVEAHARYATAVLYDLSEESAKAAQEYCQAALADPGNEALVLEVSRRLLHEKMNDAALELLVKATSRDGASGVLYARLGLIYSLLGKKELAVQANRTAVAKAPTLILGYQHLAQIYLQGGDVTEAMNVLNEASGQRDVDAGFLIELAELYLALGRSSAGMAGEAKARVGTVLDRAAGLGTKNPMLLQKLAEDYTSAGEADKATDIYAVLLERLPRLPGLRERLTELYLRRRDHERAAEMLEEIVRDNPTNPQAHYFLGSLAFDRKDLNKAVDCFKKAILLDPTLEQAYFDLAGAQINLDRPAEALETLGRARDKFKDSFVMEYLSAMAYSQMKEYANAITHLVSAEVIARATETNRLNHTFYFQLGAVYERTKKYEEAEKYFRKALAMSPDFPEALNYLGYMWAELGTNLEEAHQMIARALELEPDNAAYLDSLGWVLFRMGKPEEALSHVLKALELSEKPDPTLYDHLGDIYAKLKELEKARAAWRKALELEPSEAIQRKLLPVTPAESPSR